MNNSISILNDRADVLNRVAALSVNVNGAEGLMEVMKSNLGPRGTCKMLVGGAGQIKLTKDGAVLLSEMAIQHPTASMIARCATAQDSVCGDGTTSTVLFVGELLRVCKRYIHDGVHSRILVDGIDKARVFASGYLDRFAREKDPFNRENQEGVTRTALRTKLPLATADKVASQIVDAFNLIRTDEGADLHMVEVVTIPQGLITDTRLVRGIVMDHGCRHSDMPTHLKNAYVLIANVSLEYEKTEVNAAFFYSSTDQREKMIESERAHVNRKIHKILELKREVCQNGEGFIVLNQKGIDPISLDLLAREGIMALRRVKRRNMERLVKACGGQAVNSVESLTIDCLGFAGSVTEITSGDEKWTYVEDVKNPTSCTLVVHGPGDHKVNQIKDAVRDGLRSLYNLYTDRALVPGAGAFEIGCSSALRKWAAETSMKKTKLGVICFAEALEALPKTLAENSGFDPLETILNLSEEWISFGGDIADIGLDVNTGESINPSMEHIWDNKCVKSQMLSVAPLLASQLLLVDEVIRAGKNMGK